MVIQGNGQKEPDGQAEVTEDGEAVVIQGNGQEEPDL